jgi:hypothetical protein
LPNWLGQLISPVVPFGSRKNTALREDGRARESGALLRLNLPAGRRRWPMLYGHRGGQSGDQQ